MHQQSQRQLQERVTALSIDEVLNAAVGFFAQRGGVYSAYLEKRSNSHVALRGQGGEEVVVAAREVAEGTAVTGASYLFDQQVAQLLASLPPAPVVREPEAAPAAAPEASQTLGAIA